MIASSRNGAILMTLAAAILWGLWWAPVRLLEGEGLSGAGAALAMMLGALPPLAVAAMIRPFRGSVTARAIMGAALVGLAMTLYGTALSFTDVVRAILIFYLAPVWSTLIECLFMGRRWRWSNALALALAFGGVALIFRGEIALRDFRSGDVMALGSGMAWAVGAALIYTAPDMGARRLALYACGAGALCAGSALLLGGAQAGAWSPQAGGAMLGGLMLAIGALYITPCIIATLWGARRLSPAVVSFLLTAEIVSGVISSAIFLDERFGAPEAVGAAMVALGALVEVAATRKATA